MWDSASLQAMNERTEVRELREANESLRKRNDELELELEKLKKERRRCPYACHLCNPRRTEW